MSAIVSELLQLQAWAWSHLKERFLMLSEAHQFYPDWFIPTVSEMKIQSYLKVCEKKFFIANKLHLVCLTYTSQIIKPRKLGMDSFETTFQEHSKPYKI